MNETSRVITNPDNGKQYKLKKELGSGVTAIAWLAIDPKGQEVVLKEARPDLSDEKCRSFDVEWDYLQELQDGLYAKELPAYYVPKPLDYAKGQFIVQTIARGKPVTSLLSLSPNHGLPEQTALKIVRQVAQVLMMLHTHLQRNYSDFQMKNIFWDEQSGHVTVIDWNHLSDPATAVYSPPYHKDLQKLGGYFYRMLTGKQVDVGDNTLVLRRRAGAAWDGLSDKARDILIKAINAGANGYKTASDMVNDLQTLEKWYESPGTTLTGDFLTLFQHSNRWEASLLVDVVRRRQTDGDTDNDLDMVIQTAETRKLAAAPPEWQAGQDAYRMGFYDKAEQFWQSAAEQRGDLKYWRWLQIARFNREYPDSGIKENLEQLVGALEKNDLGQSTQIAQTLRKREEYNGGSAFDSLLGDAYIRDRISLTTTAESFASSAGFLEQALNVVGQISYKADLESDYQPENLQRQLDAYNAEAKNRRELETGYQQLEQKFAQSSTYSEKEAALKQYVRAHSDNPAVVQFTVGYIEQELAQFQPAGPDSGEAAMKPRSAPADTFPPDISRQPAALRRSDFSQAQNLWEAPPPLPSQASASTTAVDFSLLKHIGNLFKSVFDYAAPELISEQFMQLWRDTQALVELRAAVTQEKYDQAQTIIKKLSAGNPTCRAVAAAIISPLQTHPDLFPDDTLASDDPPLKRLLRDAFGYWAPPGYADFDTWYHDQQGKRHEKKNQEILDRWAASARDALQRKDSTEISDYIKIFEPYCQDAAINELYEQLINAQGEIEEEQRQSAEKHQQKFAEAQRLVEKVQRMPPGDQYYPRRARLHEAVAILDDILAEDPDFWNAKNLQNEIHTEFREILKMPPTDEEIWLKQMEVLAAHTSDDGYCEQLDQLLQHKPAQLDIPRLKSEWEASRDALLKAAIASPQSDAAGIRKKLFYAVRMDQISRRLNAGGEIWGGNISALSSAAGSRSGMPRPGTAGAYSHNSAIGEQIRQIMNLLTADRPTYDDSAYTLQQIKPYLNPIPTDIPLAHVMAETRKALKPAQPAPPPPVPIPPSVPDGKESWLPKAIQTFALGALAVILLGAVAGSFWLVGKKAGGNEAANVIRKQETQVASPSMTATIVSALETQVALSATRIAKLEQIPTPAKDTSPPEATVEPTEETPDQVEDEPVAIEEPPAAVDSDGDGVLDKDDAFPQDAGETTDTDGDQIGDNADDDDDNDGVPDEQDAFPRDASETTDTDRDQIGNSADNDDDNDGTPDTEDAFPLDNKETIDTDGDQIGNNADEDDDGDGVPDAQDAFPLDRTRTVAPLVFSSPPFTATHLFDVPEIITGALEVASTQPITIQVMVDNMPVNGTSEFTGPDWTWSLTRYLPEQTYTGAQPALTAGAHTLTVSAVYSDGITKVLHTTPMTVTAPVTVTSQKEARFRKGPYLRVAAGPEIFEEPFEPVGWWRGDLVPNSTTRVNWGYVRTPGTRQYGWIRASHLQFSDRQTLEQKLNDETITLPWKEPESPAHYP